MPATTVARAAPSRTVRCRTLAVALCGTALLLSSCREGDQSAPGNRQESAPSNAAAGAPAAAAPDNSFAAQLAAKRQALVAEAVEAVQETYNALGLLSAGDNAGAIAALERATGKLEIVLAADPNLALAPVEVSARVHDVIATPAMVNDLRRQAEAALDAGRLQEARRLIADLASEHVISVTSLPLATYPDAIKKAAAQIHAGQTAAAAATLEAALATLVVEETILPLPLLRAQALLAEARPLAEKPQRSPEENDRLRRLLAAARLQLDLARALGYASREDLDAMYDEIGKIERATEGQGSGTGLFDRIEALFAKARNEVAEITR